jgi:hypothetical protein
MAADRTAAPQTRPATRATPDFGRLRRWTLFWAADLLLVGGGITAALVLTARYTGILGAILVSFAILANLVGLSILGYQLAQWRNALRLARRGSTSQGRVIERWTEHNGQVHEYYIAYQAGEDHSAHQQVSAEDYEALQVGDTVQVRAVPRNPRISRLADYDTVTSFEWSISSLTRRKKQ